MAVNIEVSKNNSENNASLIRRFTKRVQGSGILPRLRSIRYNQRVLSFFKKKSQTLKKIRRKEAIKKLIKLGKMKEKQGRK